jgi:hypothetical protein
MQQPDLDLYGLTQEDATRQLEADGPNALPGSEAKSLLRISADVVMEPMFLMLLAAGLVHLLTGKAVPQDKLPGEDAAAMEQPGEQGNAFVFASTVVTRGVGMSRARATAGQTAVGRIGAALAETTLVTSNLQQAPRKIVRRLAGVGYCLGGTLLAMAAAHLGRQASNPLATVTLLASQVDFHEPGELGLFIDESQIAYIEDSIWERGYLDGKQMARAFALMKSNDLVLSRLIHEYLMGLRSPLTDMKAWNADATRMPYRMHSEYLRSLYLQNDFSEGRFKVDGKPIALQDVHLPMFVVSTELNHVSPWRSV